MNLLAHQYFSAFQPEWMIGNFIADEVKGKQYLNFSKGISDGILMHRLIDSFTDSHFAVRECYTIIRSDLGKFSPVAVDIFFDHFLAKNFHQFHQLKLEYFAEKVYKILNEYQQSMPPISQQILRYMTEQNWLFSYSTIEGIGKTLNGLSRRSRYGSVLAGKEFLLVKFENDLEKNFKLLMNDLQTEVENYKSNLIF
jgi:acyl carrier protein phosphodiesterase